MVSLCPSAAEKKVPCYCCGFPDEDSVRCLFGRLCKTCLAVAREGAVHKPPRECLYLEYATGGLDARGRFKVSRMRLSPFM